MSLSLCQVPNQSQQASTRSTTRRRLYSNFPVTAQVQPALAQKTILTSHCKLKSNKCGIYNGAGFVIMQAKLQQYPKGSSQVLSEVPKFYRIFIYRHLVALESRASIISPRFFIFPIKMSGQIYALFI